MKRIGLLSDTHGHWDERYATYFADVDEIWHAGDIGSSELATRLEALHPLRAVCGNIDGGDLRLRFRPTLRWKCENVEVLMTHIGGYPGNYDRRITSHLFVHPPQLFIAGHSHLLKVMFDKTLNCLHLNPGAAGIYGWHEKRTLMRFSIEGKEIKDLEIIELGDPTHQPIKGPL